MPNPTGPAAHEAHDLPLAHRIVDKLIGDYINTHSDLAAAGIGNLNDYERGMAAGIDQMRNLHLAGWDYALVPKILDELTRAGLLVAERRPDTTPTVLTWDYNEAIQPGHLRDAVRAGCGGHVTEVDTGGQDYVVVLSDGPLTAEQAHDVWEADS